MTKDDLMKMGNDMYRLAAELFPICRSITGDGVRETLSILDKVYPIDVFEVPTGTQVFDWTVPREWVVREAFIEDMQGNKIIDFKENNLHVLGYSTAVDKIVTRDELLQYVYTEPNQPDAIPYVTSYYKERFGFCMTEKQRSSLCHDKYHIFIDSELKEGHLSYGEILIPGESGQEIFLSTYICHPSMANNELSGPCVSIYLAKMVAQLPRRRYSYRFVFIPETIGSITYLSRHYIELKKKVLVGFNLSCVGDNRTYSYIESRYGNTLADKVIKNVLQFHYPNYKKYSYLERGSDERQYCSPGIDLPLCTLCRSKYGEYPEYHTSNDNMSVISPEGMSGTFDLILKCLEAIENNNKYIVKCFCEPQLGKRNLYPTLSRKGSYNEVKAMTDFLAYADGKNDLFDISNIIQVPIEILISIIHRLQEHDIIEISN